MNDASKGTKMIHAGLGVHVDRYGPLPLWVHTIDGNQNGRTAIQEHLALFAKHSLRDSPSEKWETNYFSPARE